MPFYEMNALMLITKQVFLLVIELNKFNSCQPLSRTNV